jgi:dihydrofolate synthase/folylpolyglutamate synthase
MHSPPKLSAHDYEAALEYLYGRINYERTPPQRGRSRAMNLERMRDLLRRLGDPQLRFPVVHIAGTKGKGSTATMVSAMLKSAGYRTGLYTSPHLQRLEERLVVDGRQATPAETFHLLARLRPVIEEMDRRARELGGGLRGPTFFDITTAMALLQFADHQVDIAVLEVGLGGRLDSTNVCQPLVSAITSISFDHTRQLGNSLRAIAGEKAGIIKAGVPVISGVTDEEPSQVIEEVARQQGSPLFTIGRDFDFTYLPPDRGGDPSSQQAAVIYQETIGGTERRLGPQPMGLLGGHQAANAAVALAIVGRLRDWGWQLADEAIANGLLTARCPARVEVVRRSPTVVVDAAHNVASVAALVEVLQDSFTPSPRILIFAATGDKDPAGMLRRLLPYFDEVILTRYLLNPRAADPRHLSDLSRDLASSPAKPTIHVCEAPEDAWRQCQSRITSQHLVCITGSFFLAAEMRALIK